MAGAAHGTPIGVRFMDEARVGQQGTPTRVRAKRGARPRAVRDRRYTWAYLSGAVCPERGVGAAVVLPQVNIEAMNIHLAEIGRRVTEGAHAVPVLDGAGWHASPELRVPGNISLPPLPRYAPEPSGQCPEARRERLGVPAPEPAQPPRVGQLRRHRGRLLPRLEHPDGHAGARHLDHHTRLGTRQRPGRLV